MKMMIMIILKPQILIRGLTTKRQDKKNQSRSTRHPQHTNANFLDTYNPNTNQNTTTEYHNSYDTNVPTHQTTIRTGPHGYTRTETTYNRNTPEESFHMQRCKGP